MTDQRKAYIYAIAAILMWSTMATAFKLTLRFVDSFQMVVLSAFFAFAIVFCILLVRGKVPLLFSFRPRQYLGSALLGLLNPFLYYVVVLAAYSRLLGQEAMVLNYVWPIVLVLLSALLLGQRLGPKTLLALLLSFLGVVLIATRGKLGALRFSDPLGVGLAVGSSLFWSLFWILNVKDKRDEDIKLCLNFFFGFAYALITVALVRGLSWPSPAGLAGTAYVGLFEMGVTFLLWLKAMQLTRTTALIGNLVFISPFLSLVFLHLVLGERLFPSTFAGLVLIVGGILIQRFHSAA